MSSATLLSRAMIMAALGNQAFYRAVPEFASLQPKLKTMGINLNGGGCSGCKERRVQQNVFSDFLTILGALDAGALARLKQYFGIERMMVTLRDTATGGFVTKVL